jgi:hypothetical protein
VASGGYIAKMSESIDPGAYVVRWSPWSLGVPLVMIAVVPVVFVLAWPPGVLVWICAAAFFAGGMLVLVRAIRRLVAGTVVFAVDSRGLYLGQDDDLKRPAWIPWSAVDAVVHFRQYKIHSENGGSWDRYVGVARGGQIVTARRIQGWRLDLDRLAEATRRFGGGTPIQHLPDQRRASRRQ